MKKFGDFLLAILATTVIFMYFLYYNEISLFLFPDNKDRVGELTKLLLSILGGIGIFYGLIISSRRALITEKSVDKQGEQIELARKSQIDERFKNAIEHLGNNKEPIILGGVSELVQIAKEDREKYAEVVFNILCSYIRSETNIYTKAASDFNSTVIRTIINYLFIIDSKNPFKGLNADLSSSNLSGQNLDFCDFTGANFSFTYLGSISNSILDDCELGKAEIRTSFFRNNSLYGVKLHQTSFSMVEFKDKEFKGKTQNEKNELIAANFIHCKFYNVSFDDRDLFESNFICCIFRNCTFKNSAIIESKFLLSNLSNCDFTNINLFKSVDFSGSVFNNIVFNNFISECIFKGCRIDKPEEIFIMIDKYIDKSLTINTKIDDSFSPNTIFEKCNFTKFKLSDVNEIKEFMKKLEEIRELPLNKSKSIEQQDIV